MASVSKFSRTYIASLLTSLGLIAAVLYYIFLYIPRNEERINTRYYRVMLRVGENAKLRIKNYQDHVAPNYILTQGDLKELMRNNNDVRRIGSPHGLPHQEKYQHPFWILENCPDTNQLHTVNYGHLIHLPVTTKDQNSEFQNYHTLVSTDTLLLPLMRWDTFTHFFILKKNDLKKLKSDSRVVFSATNNREGGSVNLIPTDTLLKKAYYAGWNTPQDVTIIGTPHKIFMLSLNLALDEEWLLCGAVPTSRYNTERKAIPSYILTIAFLTIAILLLVFPFLKLFLMNKEERLHQSDIVLAIVSLFIGMAFVIILLLNSYAFYGPDKNIENKRLRTLNDALKGNFVQELESLVNQLKWYDEKAADVELTHLTNIRHYLRDSTSSNSENDTTIIEWETPGRRLAFLGLKGRAEKVTDSQKTKRLGQPSEAYHYLSRVFWIDSNGTPRKVWTTHERPESMSSVLERKYFKTIKNEAGWTLPNNPIEFFLESVSSYVDGQPHAVLSIRSIRQTKDAEIAALSTKFATLSNPILPPNYGFCIVDENGEVLFHRSENLNLNENLIEETQFNPLLRASLYTGLPVDFISYYQGTDRYMYVSPIRGLPLFMVTFLNYDAKRESNANTILLTVVFLLLYTTILVILLALVIYGRKRKPKLSFGWLAFRWMWPDPQKSNTYKKNAWTLSVWLLSLALFTYYTSPIVSFFLSLYASIYAYILCYISLHPIQYQQLLKRPTSSYVTYIQRFLVSSSAIVIVTNFLLHLIAGILALFVGFIFQLILLSIIPITHFFKKPTSGVSHQDLVDNKNISKKNTLGDPRAEHNYLRRYVLLILVWLLLASAIPAYVMYRNAYDYIAETKVVLAQLHVAKKLSGKDPAKVQTITKNQYDYSPQIQSYNYAGFYQGTSQHSVSKDSSLSTIMAGAPIWRMVAKLVGLTSIDLRHVGPDQHAYCDQDSCETNQWVRVSSSERELLFLSKYQYNSGNQIMLSSYLPLFKPPSIFYERDNKALNVEDGTVQLVTDEVVEQVKAVNNDSLNYSGLFFWIDVAIFILIIYFFLTFLVTRIFNLDIQTNMRMRELEESLLGSDHQNKLLVVSLPDAPKIWYEGIKAMLPGQVEEVDLAKDECDNITDFQRSVNDNSKTMIILKHFDYQPFDVSSLKLKINYLKYFQEHKQAKIILLSTMHPSYWEQRIKEQNVDSVECTVLIVQLLNLLGNYTKLYNPLRDDKHPVKHKPPYLLDKKGFLIYFIKNECSSLNRLKQFQRPLINFVKNRLSKRRDIDKDDLILRVQSLAQLYYRQIWTSCSEEEQFFLFDLAQDGLVNGRNIKVLSSLFGKGLIVRDNRKRILLVNESFRYFVLNVVEPSEALRYEQRVARGSSWHQYKVPLLLAISGIALFIFFTQQKTWLHIVAVTTTVSTVLSLLPRLSVLLPAFLLGKDQSKG